MICQGDVPIRDLNREFGWGLPEDVAITIAGLVLHEARRIPEVGQTYAFYGFRFEILKREGTRIAELRIVPPAAIQAANACSDQKRGPAMPLSPPVGRQHLHTRRVTCQGFFRDDGLWDIEGRITDEKTYEHANEWRGPLKPGDFVHDMSIRLTVDHRFTIVDVEAVTDKSPYRICGDIAPDFKKLIGLRIGGGFHRAVSERLGGVHGCTHIVELLGPVATTAFQTVSSGKARDLEPAHRHKIGKPPKPRRSRRAQAASPTSSTTATPGPPTARWSSAGRRTSTPAPTPKPCAPPRPARNSRWTASSVAHEVRDRGRPARS